mgnify:CR=1 FL=1
MEEFSIILNKTMKGGVRMEGLEKLTGKQVVDYFTNKIAEERNIPKLLARKMVVTVIADEINKRIGFSMEYKDDKDDVEMK